MKTRVVVACVAAGVLSCLPVAVQTQAPLQVSVTVVPHCRISVDGSSAAGGPAVTASCAASTLRVLRVTTSRGDSIRPRAGRQLHAGGDAVFVVSHSEPSTDLGRTIVVTLDF